MVSSLPAWAAPPAKFEARVEAVRTAARSAGHGDRHRRERQGHARRAASACARLGSPEKVDARHHLHDRLDRQGDDDRRRSQRWSTPASSSGTISVADHIPGFQMYDPWVTREMTVRDLLVHRSGLGLGAGDLLVIPRGTSVAR